MSDPKTRRFFLGAVTAAAATRVWGANDKINVGIVGLGGRGTNHLNHLFPPGRSRASPVCATSIRPPAKSPRRRLPKNSFEKAKEFEDMRQAMFADPGVEAVSIATPNHWHALSAIWAMKAGKDVYGEKPACYNIYEGQQMLQVQRETKQLMQVGSQHRSTPFKMKAIAALQQGLIGKLYMAKGLCYKRRPSIGHTPDAPTPPGLNWDLFLGPAPMRPLQREALQVLLALVLGHRQRRHRQPGRARNGHRPLGAGRSRVAEDRRFVRRQARYRRRHRDSQHADGRLQLRRPRARVRSARQPDQRRRNQAGARGYGGSGSRARRTWARPAAAPPAAPPAAPAPTQVGPASNPLNVAVGNLFYGTEGWAAMSDQGFQAYKGESSELIMEERPERGAGRRCHRAAHAELPGRPAIAQ